MFVEAFRFTFGLSELHNPKTGELLEKEKHTRFKTMVEKVIIPAQQELYKLYREKRSDVWFDYEVAERYGRGCNGSPKSLRFYIYTHEYPKSKDPELDRPCKEGEYLFPYEENKIKRPAKRKQIKQTNWLQLDETFQRDTILQQLNSYLDKDEVDYYMEKIDKEQLRCKESYSQVIQVIYEKQKQPKFKNANKSYQRKCLINFVFTKNLQEYGWDIKAYSQDG